MEGVGDGAAAQAAVWVVEDRLGAQGGAQVQGRAQPGFLLHLADAAVEKGFFLLEEPAGHGEAAPAG